VSRKTGAVIASAKAGFGDFAFRQSLFRPLMELQEVEPAKDGRGEGSSEKEHLDADFRGLGRIFKPWIERQVHQQGEFMIRGICLDLSEVIRVNPCMKAKKGPWDFRGLFVSYGDRRSFSSLR
jgi:hypothetical protein